MMGITKKSVAETLNRLQLMSRKNVKNQLHSHIGSCEVANTICTTASQHPRSSGADESAIDIIDYAFDKFEATMLWEELNNEEIPGGVNVSCTSLPFSESSSLAKRTTESSPPAKKSGISFSSPEGPKAPPPTPDVISDNQSQDERTQKENRLDMIKTVLQRIKDTADGHQHCWNTA